MPKYQSKANGTVVNAERFRPGDDEQAGRLKLRITVDSMGRHRLSLDETGYICPKVIGENSWLIYDDNGVGAVADEHWVRAALDPVEDTE